MTPYPRHTRDPGHVGASPRIQPVAPPLDPAKGSALGTRPLIGVGAGADRVVEAPVLAPCPRPTKTYGLQWPSLCWGSSGQSPLAGSGRSPDLVWATCTALRGDVASARRAGSRDGESVTPDGGALSHGCTEKKDVAVPAGHATQSRGTASRGACRMRQLRRVEAAASCLQPLRPLRWARGGGGGQGPEGRDPRLTPDGARADGV